MKFLEYDKVLRALQTESIFKSKVDAWSTKLWKPHYNNDGPNFINTYKYYKNKFVKEFQNTFIAFHSFAFLLHENDWVQFSPLSAASAQFSEGRTF
jgi:hypothetical protein